MKFETISEAFEWMRDGYGYSEPLADCMNAHNLGLYVLESHFDIWLWLKGGQTEEQAYPTEADKHYARELAKIEELLVENSLIYNHLQELTDFLK